MTLFEKNSNDVVFKLLVDGSHTKLLNLDDGEYLAWVLVNGEPSVNAELDSIII